MNSSTTAATILVVSDHPSLCELIEVLLVRDGYRVLTAGDAEEALLLARGTPRVDLLLSDTEIPHMSGDELAAHFGAIHRSASVVFVSSSPQPRAKTEPFAYVAKPFTVAELRGVVTRALRARPESVARSPAQV